MTLAELIPSQRGSLPHPLEPWLWPASAHHLPAGDLSVGDVSLMAVARIVRDEGVSLDVCSEGELAVGAAADFPAERIMPHVIAVEGGRSWPLVRRKSVEDLLLRDVG